MTPVTIIGLGPMGQAMTRAFLAKGHPVTVWNRTRAKARALATEGAVAADTVSDALTSELVVLSLTDYQAMYDVLAPAQDFLAGRTVVNLNSDTPAGTRAAATWLADRGATLLAGGVMVPAPLVGRDGTYVFYNGPREAFDTHRDVLAVIGKPDYSGADPALAQLFYQAQLDIFLTSLSAYLHATALLATAGVTAEEFLPYAVDNVDTLSSYLTAAAATSTSTTTPTPWPAPR
jgi:3-hydroxyisobutyrate dehydrogenase-like beta-hydroxyacid dehydrogenase